MLLPILTAWAQPGAAAPALDPVVVAEAALAVLCASLGGASPAEVVSIPDAIAVETSPIIVSGARVGSRTRYSLGDGGELAVARIAPGGVLRRIDVQVSSGPQGARPVLLVQVDARCRVRNARRLRYASRGGPIAIERLEPDLRRVRVSEALDAPLPDARPGAGVPVAMVDSGVNYRLAGIASRLAHERDGRLIGYDFWDMDGRPFDANPAASPFFPQRHGTKTASLLVAEAPVARIAPYRYPRPDMSRMRALIDDAARRGIVIVNVSMGSQDPEEWRAFEHGARGHPELLFVVSAGNRGRDLDVYPTYPAALSLDNLITVTSSDASGRPAPGSNWGARAVDLAVPAENMLVTDFYGRARLASGSSYAAVRVSALAACLLAAHPGWRAPELEAAILARVDPMRGKDFVAYGFLPDPTTRDRGACRAAQTGVDVVAERILAVKADGPAHPRFSLSPSIVLLEGTGWDPGAVEVMLGRAAEVLAQCAILISQADLTILRAPVRLGYFVESSALALDAAHRVGRPALYLVKDTVRAVPFDAEAIGRSNSRRFPALADTVWMTRATANPGVSLAHELVHVLADSPAHAADPGNLMHEQSSEEGDRLSAAQCRRVVERGARNGLLERLD